MSTSCASRVLIAAGGTGGHVIPGLQVAKELRRRGWDCAFVGTERGFENRLVPQAGFELRHVPSGSLNRVSLRQRLMTLAAAPTALSVAIGLVRERRPAAALSLGGYAAGPLIVACALLDIPLVVLEPNAHPGLANRLAAPVARTVLVCHSRAAGFFRLASCVLTSLPVRQEFFHLRPRDAGARFTVLILGGSQGATSLNNAAMDAVRIWRQQGREAPRLVHQTGRRDFKAVTEAYSEAGLEAEVAPFFDDMAGRFGQADLVVCRAGASVIAELCAAGKPSVLIPFPYAADDHQRENGSALARAGGALLVEDDQWSGPRMAREVEALEADRQRLRAMGAALAPLAPVGAAGTAASAVEAAARSRGGLD